jgi:hypothetical protein
MIFLGSGTNNAFRQFKRTAAEIIAANAITAINPVKFFSVPTGEMKNIMFKNSLGANATIAAVNQKDMQKRAASYVGISISSPTSITLINAVQTSVNGLITPGYEYIYNAAQEWLKPGTKFKLQGTASNDNKTFLATAVSFSGANMTITIDTTNGAAATNEIISSIAPVKVIPFQVVDLFDVLDGDSISIDLRANNITVENSVDFYVYTFTTLATSTVNAIRAYVIS